VSHPLLTVALRSERDVVAARQRARQVARLLGLAAQDQTRVASAVSEIARNAVQYADGGTLELGVDLDPAPGVMEARIRDAGKGFASDGQGLAAEGNPGGLAAARRLVDRLDVDTGPHGTTVCLRKRLPRGQPALSAAHLPSLADALTRERLDAFEEEIHHQNRELLAALDELRRRRTTWSGSTASWRTRTAAWWRCTPSWTRRPSTCGARTR
jgi:anti-sigma regulatory factor (Ser/Thr protein kinase)